MDCEYGKDRRIRIADRLREERKSKGVTQAKMSTDLLISKPTIIAWESKNGKNKVPSPDQILALCEYFDCDYGYLLCEYDTRYHEKADIQEQTGLSEQAIDVLRKAKVITDGSLDVLREMLTNGIITIEDFERKKAQAATMTLHIINRFIENCAEISSSLGSIETFRKEHDFYNRFHAIEDVRRTFDTIYNTNAPDHYDQWLNFLSEVRPLFANGEIKNEVSEHMITDQIYEIWLGLIDEAEHRTENQYRYAINREWERIVDLILNES